jgi:hypothetical protein
MLERIDALPAIEVFATDFDGTYAITQEQSPSGINVATAYEIAVKSIFGHTGIRQYKSLGGLRNRAPGEVISELAPTLSDHEIRQKTEDLIQIKLSLLEKQVGQRLPDNSFWPRLAPGFKPVWEAISAASDIKTAVVSSGHTGFIERFHDLHEIEYPFVMVTDDDMRPLGQYLPQERIVKPSPILLDKAYFEIALRKGLDISDLIDSFNPSSVVYAGDDTHKDGTLAYNFGARYIHIDPDHYLSSWQRVSSLLFGFNESSNETS